MDECKGVSRIFHWEGQDRRGKSESGGEVLGEGSASSLPTSYGVWTAL